jgi:hypothetical protein
LPENTEEISKVAACICTLGPKLDMAVNEAMQAGDGLHAALLDAAGVGLLESLGHLSFSHICTEARKHNLFAGCRSGSRLQSGAHGGTNSSVFNGGFKRYRSIFDEFSCHDSGKIIVFFRGFSQKTS